MKMTLGKYLKLLRESRSLGLREVARLSSQNSLTMAGSISHAQLLHIERDLTKNPSLVKLITLSEIYGIDLSNLTSFLVDERTGEMLSDTDVEELKSCLYRVNAHLALIGRVNPGKDLSQSHWKRLQQDLTDAMEKVDLPLVPACDGQPPISFRFAQRFLCEKTSDAETRRKLLRLILSLKGSDLDDCAGAFMGVSSRKDFRSPVLPGDPNQKFLPFRSPRQRGSRQAGKRVDNKVSRGRKEPPTNKT